MNAKPRDLQAGWEVFRHSNFAASLDEVNADLIARGFNPVSERSYTHYRKLARYGYERYVPINRLDVETLRDPVWGSPLISRYRTRLTSVSVNIIVVYEDELVSVVGSTEELGESEASVVVSSKDSRELLASNPEAFEGLHCLVHLGTRSWSRAAVIEVVEPAGDIVRVTVGFLELVPTSDLTGREPLDPGSLRISITGTDDAKYFVNLVSTLHALFEAVDSARIVCDEVLVQLDSDNRYVLPPAQVEMLSKSSPLVVELGSGWPPLAVFGGIVLLYIRWWKAHNVGRLARKQGDEVAAKTEHQAEETRALRLRNDLVEFRNGLIKSGQLAPFIIYSVRRSLPERAADQEVNQDRLETLIERQLLPSVEEILDEQLTALDISADRTIEEPAALEDGSSGSENGSGGTAS